MQLHRSALILPLTLLALACNDGSTPPANAPSSGGASVGAPAPALDVATATGSGHVTLPKGKVVIVDFWATWCRPCEKSFPHYQSLYTKYKASGLEILAVSVDDEGQRGDIPAWVKSHGDAKFVIGWDATRAAAKAWGVRETMPTAFVVDKNGVVRHVHPAFKEGEEIELEKEIKALL